MSKVRHATRRMIANRAAGRLHAAETAIDDALHELGLLCADLPKMRQEAQLSAVVGQDLFESAGRAYGLLTDVRAEAVRLHGAFDRVRVQLDLPVVTAGPGTDKPPSDEIAPVREAA